MKKLTSVCIATTLFSASAIAVAQNAMVVDAKDRILGAYLYGFADSSPSRRPAFAILHSSGFVFRVRTMDALVAGAPIVDRGTFRVEEEGDISGIYFASQDCTGQAYVVNQAISTHYKTGVVFSGEGTGYRLVGTEFNAVSQTQTLNSRLIGDECVALESPYTSSVFSARVGSPNLDGILPSYSAPLRLVYSSKCLFRNGFECTLGK